MRVASISPDWSDIWTAAESEQELAQSGKPFVFKGPGWYIEPDSVILVFPRYDVDDPWKQEWPEDTVFNFLVWDGDNPADAFNAIVNAPTRLDNRQ